MYLVSLMKMISEFEKVFTALFKDHLSRYSSNRSICAYINNFRYSTVQLKCK